MHTLGIAIIIALIVLMLLIGLSAWAVTIANDMEAERRNPHDF